MRRALLTLPAILVSVAFASAAQAPPPAASGHLVHVDVFATDERGRSIDNLTTGDFELREEGASQTLDTVQFVRAERGDARVFAVFMDEYHVTPGANSDSARAALRDFVDREITPNDLLVVMKPLDSLFAIRFSTDRDAARQAIDSFEGRKGEYEPRNGYERNYIAGTPTRIESARIQVVCAAINALAVQMGGLTDHRKTLIVVSEGLGSPERRRGQEYLATRDTVIRSANRANVAIYPVDPRASGAFAGADGDALRQLATETDGEAIAGALDAGLRRAGTDAGMYYLLTYRTRQPDDGKFHEVAVRTTRTGIRLRARKGFVAASPDAALRAELLAHANDPKPPQPREPAPHVSALIRPWFGMSRSGVGKARVTFVWEPASRVPGDRSQMPVRLVLTALAADGSVLFEGSVAATGPAAVEQPGATPARAVFDAPAGRVKLRMSIQDAAARVLDVDVRDLAIRELKGDVAIGTPEVLRARNAREFRTLDDQAAVPVASREFSRTERLLIRFSAYGPPDAQPEISATLMSATGQAMRDLTVAPASAPGGENAVDLPLASLATGEYFVEVRATGPAGDARDRIRFRVTP